MIRHPRALRAHGPSWLGTAATRGALGAAADVDRARSPRHKALTTRNRVFPFRPRPRPHEGVRDHGRKRRGTRSCSSSATTAAFIRRRRPTSCSAAACLQHTASLAEQLLCPATYDEDELTISIEVVPRRVGPGNPPWDMPVVLTMTKLVLAAAPRSTLVLKPSPFAHAAMTLLLKRATAEDTDGVINVVIGDTEVSQAITSPRSPAGSVALAATTPTSFSATLTSSSRLTRCSPAFTPAPRRSAFPSSWSTCRDPTTTPSSMPSATASPVTRSDTHSTRNVRRSLNNKARCDRVVELTAEKDSASGSRRPRRRARPRHVAQWTPCAPPRRPRRWSASSEQIGPNMPVVAYDCEEQTHTWANDNEYGLCLFVTILSTSRPGRIRGTTERSVTCRWRCGVTKQVDRR